MHADIGDADDAAAIARIRIVLTSFEAEFVEQTWGMGVDIYRWRIGPDEITIFSDAWLIDMDGPEDLVGRLLAAIEEAKMIEDPYDLNRFVLAQENDYAQALSEIESGRKHTHWIWYIFPQVDGLGFSSTSKRYAIKSVEEARAYLDHPILGPRLIECAEAAIRIEGRTATEIFGSPDDRKVRSCATLFACVSPAGSVFDRLLAKYYRSERDGKTLLLLGIDLEGRKGTDTV